MKILIADDDPVFRVLLRSYLKSNSYEIIEADSGTSALSYLQAENPPELVFMDWKMPGYTGVELTEFIRDERAEYAPYVIMISGNDSEEHILHALSNGADDYIVKPIDSRFIQAKVAVAERIISAQRTLLKTNTLLRKLALYDELTSLFNLAAGKRFLHSELERTRRNDQFLAVALADLDNLKDINAQFGEPAGDAVIKQFAQQMQHSVRPYDVCCRYAQSTLLIFAQVVNKNEARTLFERLLAATNDCVCEYDNRPISASFSVMLIGADTEFTEQHILDELSQLLSEAKNAEDTHLIIKG